MKNIITSLLLGGMLGVSAGAFAQETQETGVDIKANGSDGPIIILQDSSATLSWASTRMDSCEASIGGPYDINGDGFVNINDATLYIAHNPEATEDNQLLKNIQRAFGSTGGSYDLNGDGFVNINDVTLFATHNPDATIQENQFLRGMIQALGTLWGTPDLTGDGFVNINDITLYISRNPGVTADSAFLKLLFGSFGTAVTDNWNGAKPLNGVQSTGNLVTGRTYVLLCSGADGPKIDSVSVILKAAW